MSNWSDLKTAISDIIKANNNQEITGTLLQTVLKNIISNVGQNYQFVNIATPETNPGVPDGNVFYLAAEQGVYSNFNAITIDYSGIFVIRSTASGSWVLIDLGFYFYRKFTGNKYIDSYIDGVYIFDPDNVLDTIKDNISIYSFVEDDYGYVSANMRIVGVKGFERVTNGKGLYGFCHNSYTNIIIWVKFRKASDFNSIHNNTATIREEFITAQDASILAELEQYSPFLDYSRGANVFLFTNVFKEVKFLNATHDYSIKYVGKINTSIFSIADLTLPKTYLVPISAVEKDSGDIEISIDLDEGTETEAKAFFYVNVDKVINITTSAACLAVVPFRKNVFHRDFEGVLQLDIEKIREDIDSIVTPAIDSIEIVKSQVNNTLSSTQNAISNMESDLSDLEEIVNSINAPEITALYNNLLTNYNSLNSQLANTNTTLTSSIEDLSSDLTQAFEQLSTAISQKTTEIADSSITLDKLSESLKEYINTAGGGSITNNPDEDTITVTSDAKLKIKDVDKNEENQVGKKRLTASITFAQNTVYELAKNITGDLSLPIGSKIKPNTGIVKGKVTGGEKSWLHSSDIGLIQGNPAYAAANAIILTYILNSNYSLILDGEYYVTFSEVLHIYNDVDIEGGKLIFVNSQGFYLENGVSFKAHNVGFVSEQDFILFLMNDGTSISYHPYIWFISCRFENIKIRMDWADVNVNSNKKGIGSLIIRNCYINTPGDVFVIDNTVFWEECVCENNRIFGLAGTTFYFAYTNEYENNVSNMANCCHIYICGNTFKGTNTANTSGYLGAAVIEARVVIFKDNYLEDIINTATESKGGGTCYDAYLSCQEVYFINNTIKNMMSYSIDNAEKPQCEIGKSKSLQDEGAFNCRVYKDNVWLVDGDYFLSLGAKEEDLYTNYFAFTSPMKNVVIENNVIKYTGKASLNGGVSSHEIEAINFSFNNIDAYEIRGYFFASRQVLTKRYEFVNNKINSRNRALIFRCPTTTGNITVNEKALIKDNVFLGQGAYIDIPETGQVEVYSLEEVTKDIAFGNFFMNSLATAFKGNLKGTIRCDLLDTTKHAYIWLDCSCKVNFTMLLRKIYKANAGHYIYLCNGSSVDVFGFRLVIEYTINGQHYKEDAVIKKAQSLFTVQCGNDIREFEDITTFNYLFEIDSLGLQVNIYASPGTDNNILIRSYILGENPETYNDKYTDISFTIKDV